MIICFITDHKFSTDGQQYYSGGGLPSAMLLRYVREDCRLQVVGRRSNAHNTSLASSEGISFHLLDTYNGPKDVLIHCKSLHRELKKCIITSDCVIMRVPSVLTLFAINICHRLHKPYLLEICGSAYDSYRYHGDFIGRLTASLMERLTRRAVASSKWTLYVTKQYLQKMYPANSDAHTLACSDATLIPQSTNVLNKRLEHIRHSNPNKKKLVCGQIGNVAVPYKGYSVMLNAMRLLREEGISVQYHIVGGGDPTVLRQEAKTLGLSDSLVIHGKIDHALIGEFMQQIDIYVHPSYVEGLPRSVAEAISYGVPCVTSNVGGLSELVQPEYMHHSGDYIKLASDLRRLAMDKYEMSRLAQQNYNHACDYYPDRLDPQRTDFINEFYKSVLKEKRCYH